MASCRPRSYPCASRSLALFSLFIVSAALCTSLFPHLLLPLPGPPFPAHDQGPALRTALHTLSLVLLSLALLYAWLGLQPGGASPAVLWATVWGRLLATPVVGALVWGMGLSWVLQLGTLTDALGALWTWRCMVHDCRRVVGQ